MSESESSFKSTVDAVRGFVHDKFIYPISQRGYDQMQRNIGEGIRQEGLTLPQAVDNVYAKMGAELILHPEDDATSESLRHGAGIFVGNNQDYGANFLYLRALRERPTDDVFFVEKAASVPYWDASAQEHILPVYYDMPLERAHGYLAEKLRRSPDYQRTQALTKEEKRALNLQTLETAATRVTEGGIVTLFPSGGGDEEASWKGGVGQIIQNLGDRRPDAKLIMGYTSGTSQWDKYKLAPGVRLVAPQRVQMYACAINLQELMAGIPQGADANTVANHLRERYVTWVSEKKAAVKGDHPQSRVRRHFRR